MTTTTTMMIKIKTIVSVMGAMQQPRSDFNQVSVSAAPSQTSFLVSPERHQWSTLLRRPSLVTWRRALQQRARKWSPGVYLTSLKHIQDGEHTLAFVDEADLIRR